MAGWLQHNVKLVKVAIVIVLAGGCFYADPINQRPSIDIIPRSSAVVHRGDDVVLDAKSSDPEHQEVDYQWQAFLCTDAAAADGCDTTQHAASLSAFLEFLVPQRRIDVAMPVQSVRVVLKATDALGATARPNQELIIPVEDRAPDLALRQDSKYSFVVGTPVQLYAKSGDFDDGPSQVTLDWMVFSPSMQPTYTLDDLSVAQDPGDPDHHQSGKTFVPHGIGAWDIQVTATDPLSAATVDHLTVNVVPDHAPCLGELSPIVAPQGQTLPMSDPTLFQVLTVHDDLDPYPTTPSDPLFGSPKFTWSLLAPGASRQVLGGVTGASVALDPATYHPGDILELRVEIQDRNHTPINCADASATCSVISDQTCIQRQTWRVEVR